MCFSFHSQCPYDQDVWFVKRFRSMPLIVIQFQMVSWHYRGFDFLFVHSSLIQGQLFNLNLFLLATCLNDGVEVQKSSVKCEIKTGCKLIQRTGECCPDYQCCESFFSYFFFFSISFLLHFVFPFISFYGFFSLYFPHIFH